MFFTDLRSAHFPMFLSKGVLPAKGRFCIQTSHFHKRKRLIFEAFSKPSFSLICAGPIFPCFSLAKGVLPAKGRFFIQTSHFHKRKGLIFEAFSKPSFSLIWAVPIFPCFSLAKGGPPCQGSLFFIYRSPLHKRKRQILEALFTAFVFLKSRELPLSNGFVHCCSWRQGNCCCSWFVLSDFCHFSIDFCIFAVQVKGSGSFWLLFVMF